MNLVSSTSLLGVVSIRASALLDQRGFGIADRRTGFGTARLRFGVRVGAIALYRQAVPVSRETHWSRYALARYSISASVIE